ncbi:MAG TPA: hypothetical protein VFX30_00300 [bacterium]|nr:hypothetical protein [bacterium]
MTAKRRFFPFVLLIALLFPEISRGATTGLSGYDLRLFRPPTDASGFLNLHGSKPLGRWKFAVGTISDTSHGMLTVASPVTGNPVEVIDEYFTNTIVGAFGLTNFLHAGLSIPMTYFLQGNHVSNGSDYAVATFGDVGLEIKGTLLKDKGLRPGIALVSITTFPSGSTEDFTGSSNVTEEVKLVVDKRIGPVYLALNGGYRMLERTQVADLDVNDMLTYGGGFSWALPFGRLELMAEVDGAMVAGNRQSRTSPLEWLAGIRQKAVEGLSIDFAGGTGIGDGVGGGDFRLVAGITFRAVPPQSGEPEGKQDLLTETITFRKDGKKIDEASRPAMDRIEGMMRKEEKSEAILRGDPALTKLVAYDLQDRGISRGRTTDYEPKESPPKKGTVEVRVIRAPRSY